MTPTQIHKLYKTILRLISEKKMVEALENLKLLNQEYHSTEIDNKIKDVTERYTYLLNYFMEGVNDPERNRILDKIISDSFLIVCKLRELLLVRDSNNFEFSQMRYFPLSEQKQSKQLLEQLNRDQRLKDIENDENHQEERKQIQVEFENALGYLFNAFWLSSNDLQTAFNGIYTTIISNENSESIVKSMLVSALTFSLWRTFDEKKMLMLLDACNVSEIHCSQRALVGLVFVLAKYNAFIPYFPKIRNRLSLLVDDAEKVDNLENIFFQIIETTETEEITRKLQQEIYPELMKLKPILEDSNIEQLLKADEWDELNPEWKDTLKSSGVYDKMEELTELQKSGSDIYMSTFSQMKSHPFFNTFSNWLLPFDINHSLIEPILGNNGESIFSVFLDSPMMCNSDKYSFGLSMLNMPELQQNMMKQDFREATEQLKETQQSELITGESKKSRIISKHYIQDLFRLFKLNSKKKDFSDMFSISLLLHKTYLFDLLKNNSDIKSRLAEYYFSKKLYQQALELYEKLESNEKNNAEFYQRMGYCYQQTSQLVKALETYKKSDLIRSDDFWTLRKIAMCYRLLGDYENATHFYKELKRLRSNNISVRLQLVDCLSKTNQIKEALQELTELNKTYPNHDKILRKTVYLALLDNNLAQANYFQSLIFEQDNLLAEDYLFAGHIAWIMNRGKEAIERYKRMCKTVNFDGKKINELFENNTKILLKYGVEKEEVILLKEAILQNQE